MLALTAVAVIHPSVATRFDVAGIAAQAPDLSASSAPRADRDELMRVVRTLAAPELGGRRTGTPGGLAARRFIRDAFEDLGLSPTLQPFSFEHSNASGAGEPGGSRAERSPTTAYQDAANVIAIQPGSRADGRTIVVSAHYDHVGVRDGVVYPGADDNASGVAALLAVGRYLHAHPPAHRVVLAAFDAEELGQQGAAAFLRNPPVPRSSIGLNVNLDMVSRNDHNEIFAAGTYHTPALKGVVDQVQRRSAVTIRLGHDRPMTGAGAPEDWTLQSDHGEFHKTGIPFLYLGVEDHADYHKPTDTADKISPTFFGAVVDMLIDVVVTADQTVN